MAIMARTFDDVRKYYMKRQFQDDSINGFTLFDALSDKPGGFDDNDDPFWSERQVRDQRAIFDNIMATRANGVVVYYN